MSSLDSYWPTNDSVRDCLKVDAEAADPAVLLAVHQPMRFQRRDFGAGFDPRECNEEDLFRALLAETGDGRVIVPIIGDSGVGKSHVIRWLDARLQHAPGSELRVVHRISKGQSLKRIVTALLERPELAGERFTKIRQRLETARERLSDTQVANLLCEVLAQAVADASEDAARRILRGEVTSELRLQRDLGKVLPALLREPSLRQLQWVERPGGAKGCVSRLVEQFTTSVEADEDDPRKHQFEASDLEFDTAVDPRRLSEEAQNALRVLQLHRDNRRPQVAMVLNAALDDAKRQVLGLETSVSELFEEVRKQLLAEGKELVLLIEDFAVLSGMQKELLQAVIKEGADGHGQGLCTLRTALAYTQGSASFLFDDTYRSRARSEWLVPEAGVWSEEDLDRVVRLVAAYLNAARVGVSKLRSSLEAARARGTHPDATRAWIPHAKLPNEGSRESDTLRAFGEIDGNYLFPFNRAAIGRLVEEGCKKGQNKVYNPRLILQRVLLRVLERRHEFLSRSFPGNDFRAERYKGHVIVAAKAATYAPKAEVERRLSVLAYWYEDCRTWEELETRSPFVLEAFNLTAPWHSNQRDYETPLEPLEPNVPPEPERGPKLSEPSKPKPPKPPIAPPTAPDDDLRKWSEGQSLGFDRARKTRQHIARALDGTIQWHWFCAEPRRTVLDNFEAVIVPRADGGLTNLTVEDAVAVPWTEDELDDLVRSAGVLGQVKALERYLTSESGWDYEEPELDAARYCALIERTSSQASAFILARPVKEREDSVPTLVSGLALSARALNVPGGEADDHVALVAAILDERGQPPSAVDSITAWSQAEKAMARWRGLSASAKNENWRTALLRLTGARQGKGDSLAIDVRRLKPALDEVSKKWTLPIAPKGLEGFVDPHPSQETQAAGAAFKLRSFDVAKTLAEEVTRVSAWGLRVEKEVGRLDDSEALARVCEAVEVAMTACQNDGYATAKEAHDILTLNDIVRMRPVSDLVRNAGDLAAATDTGTRLRLRARHDQDTDLIVSRWLDYVDRLFTRIEGALPAASGGAAPDPVTLAREEFAAALDGLAAEFERGAKP